MKATLGVITGVSSIVQFVCAVTCVSAYHINMRLVDLATRVEQSNNRKLLDPEDEGRLPCDVKYELNICVQFTLTLIFFATA